MQAVHDEADGSLPVFRGEFPNTDYTVCATCTPKETAVNRNAHNLLMTAENWWTTAQTMGPGRSSHAARVRARRTIVTWTR